MLLFGEFWSKLFYFFVILTARAALLTGRLPIRNGFYTTNDHARNGQFTFMFMHCVVFEVPVSNAWFKLVSHTNVPCSISSREGSINLTSSLIYFFFVCVYFMNIF